MRGPAEINGIEKAVEDQTFDGGKNPIILKREFYQEFTCDFDLSWYPFDRQVCFMNFTVQGETSKGLILRPDLGNEISYLGETYLVEYHVDNQSLHIPKVEHGNFSTASVEVVFRRRVVYHLLNIFLQSLLLVLTGYMSIFFHVNNFSDRVMVALTVMLVMASLQTSVQDALPKTAYFKFIDWWILFAMNTQIGLMAFHTFLSMYTAREYRRYKESMLKRIGKVIQKEVEANGGSTNHMLPLPTAQDLDEIIPIEEFDFPKSNRLNKWVNILFIALLMAFNVAYWSIAMGIYFS
jgi:ABC-type multidrug transport system fused ATPase/permease subunit